MSAPTVAVHRSFLAAMAEFREEGRGSPTDDSMIGGDLRGRWPAWTSREVFAAYVAELLAQPLEDSPRPAGWVPCTTLWLLDGEEYLGRLAIRHRLTPHLVIAGGHIGYDVRRSARGRGHATAMLCEALPIAHALGIDPALVACDIDNIGSRRVIESNGGRLEDQRGIKLRYWVPTAGP